MSGQVLMNGSGSPHLPILCALCTAAKHPPTPATISCSDCGLQLCFPCAFARHQVGGLTRHSLSVQPTHEPPTTSAPFSSALLLSGHLLCQLCTGQLATISCPLCEVHFCASCATSFHTPPPLLVHKARWIYAPATSATNPTDDAPTHSFSNTSPIPSSRVVPFATLLPAGLPLTSATSSPAASPAPPSALSKPSRPPIVPPRPLTTFAAPRPHPPSTPTGRDSRANSTPLTPLTPPTPRSPNLADLSPLTPRTRSNTIFHSSTKPHSNSVSERRRASELSLPTPFNPLSAVSPARRLLQGGVSAGGGVDGPSSSTFKLSDYALSLTSTPLRVTSPPPFTLTLDPVQQLLSVASVDGVVHHTRALSSLSMVTHSLDTPTLFTIYFNDSKPLARCLSTSPSEALLLYSLISSFIDQLRLTPSPPPCLHPLLYHGRIQKKSQLRWKAMYVAVRPWQVLLYRGVRMVDEELHRSINLQGCAARVAGGGEGLGDRGWMLEQREGKMTLFRMVNAAERDTLLALVQKAMARAPDSAGEEEQGEEGEGRPDSNGHQLRVNTMDSSRSAAQAILSPSSLASLPSSPSLEPESTPLSPRGLTSLTSFSTTLPSPYSTSSHLKPAQLATVSRRRSRRTMSKDFAQLRHRERAPPLACTPSSSSSASASSASVGVGLEFVELPPDPRPVVELSPVLGVGLYSLLSALLSSFISGAALTPSLYVPKGVWQQTGRKVQAFGIKVECWDTLHEQLLALPHPPLSASASDALMKDTDDGFQTLQAVLEQVHERLSQHLPYIPVAQPPQMRRNLSSHLKSALHTQALSRLLSRATDAASLGFRKLDEADNSRYCEVARAVLEGVVVLRQWHSWVERARAEQGEGGERLAGLSAHLQVVDEFLYTVFANVLLHDLASALQRYMKHAYRGLSGNRMAGAGAWTRAGATITAVASSTIT